jgi:hypothetical protein
LYFAIAQARLAFVYYRNRIFNPALSNIQPKPFNRASQQTLLKRRLIKVLPAGFTWLSCMALIVVAAASAASAESLSPTAATRTVGLRLRLIDFQRASTKLRAVQRGHRFIGLSRVRHLDEREAAGAAGFAVCNNANPLDRSVRFENSAKFGFGGAVR